MFKLIKKFFCEEPAEAIMLKMDNGGKNDDKVKSEMAYRKMTRKIYGF